jgi:hypothetical protein
MTFQAIVHIVDLIALGMLLTIVGCVVWLGFRIFNAIMGNMGRDE